MTVNVSAREGEEFFTVRYTVRLSRLVPIDGERFGELISCDLVS